MTTVSEREASVALPGDPAFDAATGVFNLAAPAQPVAAVTVRTVEQVRAAIRSAIDVALFPAAAVVTGSSYWPAERAPELLRAWREWTVDAPREAATSFRVMNLPPLEEIPAALRSGTVVGVDGVVLAASEADLPT